MLMPSSPAARSDFAYHPVDACTGRRDYRYADDDRDIDTRGAGSDAERDCDRYGAGHGYDGHAGHATGLRHTLPVRYSNRDYDADPRHTGRRSDRGYARRLGSPGSRHTGRRKGYWYTGAGRHAGKPVR